MSYIRDRLIQAFVTIYAIITLGFVLTKLIPGGPVEYLRQDMAENPTKYGLPPEPTPGQIRRAIEALTNVPPDEPLHQAYIQYMLQLLQGDFGESIVVASGTPVIELIMEAAPWTIFLSVTSLLTGICMGVAIGGVMAYYEGTKFDVGMTIGIILDGAVPYYVAAIFLLMYLGFGMELFPTGGRYNPDTTPGINWPFISSVFHHAALPMLSFAITGFGAGGLALRANAIRLLGSEHIRVARLRGLSAYRITTAYLIRNAVLPLYTTIVIGLGSILGGSIIIEQIFQYPGMGLIMFRAAITRDFPLLMAAFIITSVIFVIGTLIADFTYSLIDPRADVRAERSG